MPSTFVDSAETLSLLHRAKLGDDAAIELLFARHLPGVKGSVRRRLSPQCQPRFDESDVIQETHELARRQLADYLNRRPMPFGLWLLRTARQRLIDYERAHLRSARRAMDREVPLPEASSLVLAQQFIFSGSSPSGEAARQEQARIVRQCLAELAELDREVLLLRIFDGLKHDEVALLLDIHPEAAKKRFTRALLRLKDSLRAAGLREDTAR